MLNYDRDRDRFPIVYDNLDGVTDLKKWEKREFDYTQHRVGELERNPTLVKQTFDGKHLLALHKHIFQDCYEWAGELRDNGGQTSPYSWHKTKKIDGVSYTSIYTPDSYIKDRLPEIQQIIKDAGNPRKKEDVLSLVATLSDRINEIHAFREGNSRTKRMFIKQVAERSGFTLDFSRIGVKELTEKEFIANSIIADGKSCALNDSERVGMLKDLYSPLLVSRALLDMKTNGPKNTPQKSSIQKSMVDASEDVMSLDK